MRLRWNLFSPHMFSHADTLARFSPSNLYYGASIASASHWPVSWSRTKKYNISHALKERWWPSGPNGKKSVFLPISHFAEHFQCKHPSAGSGSWNLAQTPLTDKFGCFTFFWCFLLINIRSTNLTKVSLAIFTSYLWTSYKKFSLLLNCQYLYSSASISTLIFSTTSTDYIESGVSFNRM